MLETQKGPAMKIKAFANQTRTFSATGARPAPRPAKENQDLVDLRFVHVNDTHGIIEPIFDPAASETGKVGGFSRMATVIKQARAENPQGTITVHSGDHAEGSMIAYLSRGKVVKEAEHNLFDVRVPGNHDHAWGMEAFRDFFHTADGVNLCANVVQTKDDKCPQDFKPYQIFERKGVKIGVIGLNTPEVPHYVAAQKLEGLRFEDPLETVKRYLPQVKKEGAQVVVLADHVGLKQPERSMEDDIKIARALQAARKENPELPKVDLIVGAHTHDKLDHGMKVGETLIVQAGALTENVGVADLIYSKSRHQVISAESKLVPVTEDVKPDADVEAAIAPYVANARAQGAKVMGKALEPIDYSHREAAKLNQIHADSLLEKTDADIVLCNSRTLRAGVPAGDVTYEQLYSALPFTEDGAITLTAKGSMVRQQIEDGVRDGARELAVPAGLKYTYDPGRPSGHRVTSVTLCDGSPLKDDKDYRVGMNWTMSGNSVWDKAKDRRTNDRGCQALFFEKFQQEGPWKNDPDDRVTRL